MNATAHTDFARKLTKDFARQAGYIGDDPALLAAIEHIRQKGIHEGRRAHFERKKLVDQFRGSSHLFFAAIRPALSTQEAIEDANHCIASYRNLPTYRKEARLDQVNKAKLRRLMARFFRRYGERAWAREAA